MTKREPILTHIPDLNTRGLHLGPLHGLWIRRRGVQLGLELGKRGQLHFHWESRMWREWQEKTGWGPTDFMTGYLMGRAESKAGQA